MASSQPPPSEEEGKLIGVIGDEDTVCGFLLAGVGQRDAKGANFLVVDAKTSREAVEEMFTRLVQRGDTGLIIINQPVAALIRPVIEAHTAKVPMVLEIPAAGGGAAAFDMKKDPIMCVSAGGMRGGRALVLRRFLRAFPRLTPSPASLSLFAGNACA